MYYSNQDKLAITGGKNVRLYTATFPISITPSIISSQTNQINPSHLSASETQKLKTQTHQKHAPEQASNQKEKKEEMKGKTESGREITSKRKKTTIDGQWHKNPLN